MINTLSEGVNADNYSASNDIGKNKPIIWEVN